MASGTATNRTNIDLPAQVTNEVLQKVKDQSAVMQLAREMKLPGNGAAINVITSDPEASWVGETSKKPVSNPGLATKILRGYTLAVIVPFSNQFKRDASALYGAIIDRLPGALAKKFDSTVFGDVQAPGSDFDTFAEITQQSIKSDAYGGLVAADGDVADNGGLTNGYAISPKAKGILLASRDETGRPLFINSVAEGAIPMILGAKTVIGRGAYAELEDATIVGAAGDWNQAVWGMVEGLQLSVSDQATLDLGDGTTINLFQQNMFAVRAEIEVGFRANLDVFNALTTDAVPSV